MDDLLEKFVLELTNVPDYKRLPRAIMILERGRALPGLEGTVVRIAASFGVKDIVQQHMDGKTLSQKESS